MQDTYRKLYDLLDGRERRNAIIVLAMMLILGMMEALGVASIMPFLAVLADPGIIERNKYLASIYEQLGFTKPNDFLLLLAVAVFGVAVVRVTVSAVSHYFMIRFSTMRTFSLSARLLEKYLRQPYDWFLQRHSSDLGKTILSEVDQVVRGSLIPSLQLIARIVVASFIILVLIFVDPIITLSAMIAFGGGYSLIYLIIRKYLNRIGKERLNANQQRFHIAQEVLGGIKEVKVSGLEEAYLQRFKKPAFEFSSKRAASQIIGQFPKYILEALTLGGMLAIVMVLFMRASGDVAAVLPIIGLYAFSGLRLLPSLQDIYQNLTKLGFGKAALDSLHKDLMDNSEIKVIWNETRNPTLQFKKNLELRNITYTYPKSQRPVLTDLSLKIPARTTVGFVGATGAGKTTIVDVILGLLKPEQGEMLVDGQKIDDGKIRYWQRTIGYVPQHIFLSDDTIAGNIAFGVPPKDFDMAAIERAARFSELHNFVNNELPLSYETMVGERGVRLSGGQRQRVGIARALYHDPDILILDEATSALDNLTEKAILDALQNLSHVKTVLLIAHRLSTVRTCDRIFYLDQGCIKEMGTYEELIVADAGFRELSMPAELH